MKSERINKRHEKLETSLSQQLVKYKHTWIQYRYWKYQIPRISISLEIFFSFSRLFFKIWYMKCPESADTVNDTKAVVDTIRVIYMAQASRFLRVIVLASECNWSHGFRNSRTVGGFCLSHRFSRAFFALALPWAEERYQNETVEKRSCKGRCGNRKIVVEDGFDWNPASNQDSKDFGNVSCCETRLEERTREEKKLLKEKKVLWIIWRNFAKVTFIPELMMEKERIYDETYDVYHNFNS